MNQEKKDIIAGIVGGIIVGIITFGTAFAVGKLTTGMILGGIMLMIVFSIIPLEKIWSLPGKLR